MTPLRTTTPVPGRAQQKTLPAPDPHASAHAQAPPDLTPDLDPAYKPFGVPPDPYAIGLAVREVEEQLKKEKA